jgi:hypothetical protein
MGSDERRNANEKHGYSTENEHANEGESECSVHSEAQLRTLLFGHLASAIGFQIVEAEIEGAM